MKINLGGDGEPGVPIMGPTPEELERLRRRTVHLQLTEDGPMIDLGCTAPELFDGILRTLGSVTKKVKPSYVSPILGAVLDKLKEARNGQQGS